MAITEKLTGERRLRVEKRLFKEPLLVVQVEVNRKGYVFDADGIGPSIDVCYWRDARLQDLEVNELFKGG